MAISVTSPWSRSFLVDTNVQPPPFKPKREIKVGELFSLLVRVRNLSTNETLSCYNAWEPNTDLEVGLACEVISPSGKHLSPSRRIAGGSAGFAVAGPGQTTQYEFGISGLCKLDEIGTYKITARKRAFVCPKGEKAFVLTSNTLCVSVVPGKE
ncbi:MAG: hypothetical protein NT167_15340 [Verrucomicrobia bacterium]|nr:hypothetical protein [Verrucomicrobiota bacterium]